jgi:TetR/AcrR family transcriptional repressor of nem operon
MELGACHECASGSNLAFHVDFCSQIHRFVSFRSYGFFAEDSPDDALATLVGEYLSAHSRDEVEKSCPLSAIGTELRRTDSGTAAIVRTGMERLISLVAQQITGVSGRQAEARAHGMVAAMVGGIVLSRLANDRHLADSILRDTRKFILHLKRSRG